MPNSLLVDVDYYYLISDQSPLDQEMMSTLAGAAARVD